MGEIFKFLKTSIVTITSKHQLGIPENHLIRSLRTMKPKLDLLFTAAKPCPSVLGEQSFQLYISTQFHSLLRATSNPSRIPVET